MPWQFGYLKWNVTDVGQEAYVIPGNIIFRQRGTLWFPGENCSMGRDHTIHASVAGYVRYYKDPARHPNRQYIGVVFDRHDKLPYPVNAARKRKLGRYTVPIKSEQVDSVTPDSVNAEVDAIDSLETSAIPEQAAVDTPQPLALQLKDGYMYRESNWEIGRAAERAGIVVPKYKRGDRWATWRRSAERKAVSLAEQKMKKLTKKRK